MKPGEAKEAEFVETVVAFANSQGGRLYVGVADDGTPQGDQALRRTFEAATAAAADALVKRLRKLIRERTKPVASIEVARIEHHGDPVFVVKVSEGDDGPYSTVANDVYVRKTASNMRPDPREMLQRWSDMSGRRRR